jgi:hypothetical protein
MGKNLWRYATPYLNFSITCFLKGRFFCFEPALPQVKVLVDWGKSEYNITKPIGD